MKYCPKCDSEYAARFRYCRMDGTPLVDKQISEPPQSEGDNEEAENVKLSGSVPDHFGQEKIIEVLAPSFSHPQKPEDSPKTEQTYHSGDLSTGESEIREPVTGGSIGAETGQAKREPDTKAMGGERFERLAQEEINKAFPHAFVRVGVQIKSFRRTTEADLFVLLPKGLFLVECKNYSGKISGSLNYDQQNGEYWTCETLSGETVQIKASGKNPADQALTRFHALHDIARDAWGEENRPYIYPVLLFPDSAELSGVTGLTVYPEKPSNRDRVVATTLSKLISYLANADSIVEHAGALRLIEFLGFPYSSLAGTWLVEQPERVEKTSPKGNGQVDKRLREQSYETPREQGVGDSADEYKQKIPIGGARPDLKDSSRLVKQQGEPAKYIRRVLPKPRSRQVRWPLVAFTLVIIAVIGFMVSEQLKFKPPVETASLETPPPETSLQEPPTEAIDSVQPQVQSVPAAGGMVAEPPATPSVMKAPIEPQEPASIQSKLPGEPQRSVNVRQTNRIPPPTKPLEEAKARAPSIPRRPAEPGTYETIRVTRVWREPNESADVFDELKPGRRLNVIDSQGEWLVVRSRTQQTTVYIKRDDAMFVSSRRPSGETFEEAQVRWKQIELEITEVLVKKGITGVSVSVIGDTAYLEGQVKTENERFTAKLAAESSPDVKYVNNGIWVRP